MLTDDTASINDEQSQNPNRQVDIYNNNEAHATVQGGSTNTPSINQSANHGTHVTNHSNRETNLTDTSIKSPNITHKDNSAESEQDDRNDLLEAGLNTTQERPFEKVYNEWITTFSDDSLFDEMTETLNSESRTDNRQKSPEQRAARKSNPAKHTNRP